MEEATWAHEKTEEGAALKRALLEELVRRFGIDEVGHTKMEGVREVMHRMEGIDEGDPQFDELLRNVGGVTPEEAMSFMGSVWHIGALEFLLENTLEHAADANGA